MAHYGVPGVTVTVIDNGKIAWTHVVGLADRDANIAMRKDTLLQAGSVSKPVAAVGAMRLVQDGTLALQQPVNERLASWRIPDNEFTREAPVTLAHLLSHTGGLTVHGFGGYPAGTPVPDVLAVLDGKTPANSDAVRVDQLPGKAWRYSGGGYTVAQLLMAEATGEPFAPWMQRHVFDAIGMRDSSYVNPLPDKNHARAATGVTPDGKTVPGRFYTYPEMAAAGLWTTSQDLALLVLEMQRALKGKGHVLNANTARTMLTPAPASPDYGYGFILSNLDGARYFGHSGWDEGFCALLVANQTLGQAVVIMINANQPAFMAELQRAVAHEYAWPGYKAVSRLPASASALATAPGRYRVNGEQFVTVDREGDRLYLTRSGDVRSELVPVGDNRYVQREQADPRSFHINAQGQRSLQLARKTGEPLSFDYIPDGQRHPRELLLAGDPAALEAYRALRDAKDAAGSEDYLNNEGLRLVARGQKESGLAMLVLNTQLYPASANTWDSLGEAHLSLGDTDKARAAYRQALVIDPAYPSSKAALQKLGDATLKP